MKLDIYDEEQSATQMQFITPLAGKLTLIISLTQETANVSNANFKSQSQSILSYLSFKYFQRFITWIPNFVDLCI